MFDKPRDDQQRKLLEGDDHESNIVYVKERRGKFSLFTSGFGSFALGVVLSCAVFGLLLKQGHLVVRKSYAFAKTDAFPQVPMESVTFESNPVYSERANDDTDAEWNKLLPPGRGYVFVDDAEERQLLPGQNTQHGDIYSVSMFHQLHCLARLRTMQWHLIDGVVTGEEAIARTYVGREAMHHVQHCFDYLRQGIICAGDMTLEWPKQDGPSSGVAVDGWGVPHQCKSKAAIDDFMNKFHFNESMYIDAAGK